MHDERYCCFAIPLYSAGIYVILAQFAVIGLLAGVLSLAAPSVLAVVVPTWMTAVFGVLCIFIGVSQAVGFLSVYKEKAKLFRKYFHVNVALVGVTIVYTLVIIIVSATRHSQAIDDCVSSFISGATNTTGATSSSSTAVSGRSLCNVWTWSQLGVCGVLWLLLGASEIYFCIMERIWGKDQRQDHLKYRSIVSAARESIALRPSQDWDASSRPGSLDVPRGRHGRTDSMPAIGSRLRNEVDWEDESSAQFGGGEATQPQKQDRSATFENDESGDVLPTQQQRQLSEDNVGGGRYGVV